MKLLLAEDVSDNAYVLTQILTEHYEKLHVVWEKNGELALQEFINCHKLMKDGFEPEYDCVITDMQMPLLTGVQLAEEIRKFNRFVPVFLWTGGGFFQEGKRAMFRAIVSKDDHKFWLSDVFRRIYDKIHS